MLVLFYLCLSFVLFGISLIIKSKKKKIKDLNDLLVVFIPQLFNSVIALFLLIISFMVKKDSDSYFYFFGSMIFFVPSAISCIGILSLLYKQKCQYITKCVKKIEKKFKGKKKK